MAAVFAYGSLVSGGGTRARLTGWSRTWNVCTDNTANGPVVYADPADGTRPPIQVLFLTIEPGAGAVEGVLLPLSDEELPALDAREGNYTRVTVEVDDFGPAWAYVAKAESADRARRGVRAGTARIRRHYLDTVLAAYLNHEGIPAPWPLPAPVVDLDRIRR
ncbi:gamma-glutamylcyclotransferase [Actinoplanes sp. KI2]|uniref:gamma-glutamylcyclotransferase family protein n=1 Tax=Actinoplanes sp. KI2 TaxID=2983315 RepID=UPI0021D5C174|nr:gamma-glutamylcyclotransferase family protein [Actinoplanes sp. KI2]MCU7727755.1 gamma-glutamylcyclotransferase [Actinoplanes sp. KI2]